MKIGVVIERSNYYRLLGPVVDAALARGWQVVCLHDYAQPRDGSKGYLFPAVERMPRFRHGTPGVAAYRGSAALRSVAREQALDVVLSILPPPSGWKAPREPSPPVWISLQYHAEIFRYTDPRVPLEASAVGVYSDWWVEWGLRYWRSHGVPVDDDKAEIRRKAVVVGFPELDRLRLVERAQARLWWGFPADRPVVLFLPFPIDSFHKRTHWYRWVYDPRPRPAVKRLRLRLAGRRDLIPQVDRGVDDAAMVRAVRSFCDANGALLVAKSRQKDRVAPYVREAADRVLEDESDDPPTILHALAAADLCVHFFSTAVMEAVASGVPSLSLCPELDDEMEIKDDLFSRTEGDLFQFDGVARTLRLVDAIDKLPQMSLVDLRLDPARRAEYVTKFLGFSDGKSADRLLDVVLERVEEARR
jgi:hypothetical protein